MSEWSGAATCPPCRELESRIVQALHDAGAWILLVPMRPIRSSCRGFSIHAELRNLVEGDPLRDVSNVSWRAGVMVHGRLDEAEFQRRLVELAQSYSGDPSES